MTATNHALTGALIGLTIHQPILAIPTAFVSHYVLDAIPHMDCFFFEDPKTKAFRFYLATEAILCFMIVLILAISQPAYWQLSVACAFVAASPDFMWLTSFIAQQNGKRELTPKLWFVKLHAKVQWFTKPIGLLVEIAWAFAAILLLANIIKK